MWGKPIFIAKRSALLPNPVTEPIGVIVNYDNRAHDLVIPGSVVSGTMEYSIDGTIWGALIPRAKNEGAYTVYWRVVNWASNYAAPVPSSGSVISIIGTG